MVKAACLERARTLVQWLKLPAWKGRGLWCSGQSCLLGKGGGPGAVVKAACLERAGALVQWLKLPTWKGRGSWCSG